MHYDFKKKVNKIDSQKYRNLRIPEIDWVLNEAAELFVKMIAEPRLRTNLGFETSQRSIDDIKNIVVTDEPINVTNNIVSLPTDYWYFAKGKVIMEKGDCKGVKGKLDVRQHDDDFEISPFDNSSFEWREVNGVFNKDGIKLYTENFTVTQVLLSYIRKLTYMHNAEDFNPAGYNLPSGTTLVGSFDCELSEHTHKEIVDIAVLITTGELESQGYQIKQSKLKMNGLD